MSTVIHFGREIDYLEDLGSKLRNLKGYATLAHELLQNADDAPGVRICRFDVCEDGLLVENDGRFSDCGSLGEDECPWKEDPSRGHRCDFHRFRKVAGGHKRREGNTTGAFGIGFISVYQITDRPELISGRHWILDECEEPRKRITQCGGCDACWGMTDHTRFVLPWARNPHSPLRRSLRAQAVGSDVVKELLDELETSLPAALIFLKNIEKVEILHEGKMVRCIERIVDDDRVLIAGTSEDGDEVWHVFRGKFRDRAAELRNEHGDLIEEKRRPEVAIALRQHAILKGLLCATLPTQQCTGLPFHINGDFFPSEDRKRVILEKDFQGDWNRAVLECAAGVFGDSLESIRDRCEPNHLWGLIDSVKAASENPNNPTFGSFWEKLRPKAQAAEVVLTSAKQWRTASEVSFLQQDDDPEVMPILEAVGIEVVHADLRSFRKLLIAKDGIGVPTLTLESLLDGLIEAGLTVEFPPGEWPRFLRHEDALGRVWNLIDRIWKRADSKAFHDSELRSKAGKLALAVRRDGALCPCGDLFAPLSGETVALFHAFDSDIPFAAESYLGFEKGSLLSQSFGPQAAITRLETIGADRCAMVLAKGCVGSADLIAWFEQFRADFREDKNLAERLARLQVFPSGGSFKPLNELSLPGDFEDPLKMADVLDVQAMPRFHDFLRDLGVQELSLTVFVSRHLIPALEVAGVPLVAKRAACLFLARKRSEISEVEGIREGLSSVPLVECDDGEFRAGDKCYLPEETVFEVLGSEVSTARIPAEHKFVLTELLEWMGVAGEPRVPDILKRIRELVAAPPTAGTVNPIQRVFEFLGHRFRVDEKTAARGLESLKKLAWLPARNDAQKWHAPEELHAEFRKYLFESQARFLAFPVPVQQHASEFLKFLGVTPEPTPDLVVSHLLNCARSGIPVHPGVYAFLNDNHDDSPIVRLRGQACLLLPDRRYVRPDMVFWNRHSFGRFRWEADLNSQLRDYRKLFDKLGVKETPTWHDALSVLQEIGRDVGAANELIDEALRGTVMSCWQILDRAVLDEKAEVRDLKLLRKVKCVPNGQQLLIEPCLMFFEDRAGLAAKFEGFLEQNTIPRPAGACLAMAAAGVRPLAVAVKVDLLECEAPRENRDVANRVKGRLAVLARVLDAQHSPAGIQAKIGTLEALRFEEADLLKISYTLSEFGTTVSSKPEDCPALFQPADHSVLFMCPGGKVPWTSIAREISRAIDPDHEPGASAAAIKDVLAADSVKEATVILDELGFATLSSPESAEGRDGQTLDALGGTPETEEGNEGKMPEDSHQAGQPPDSPIEGKAPEVEDDIPPKEPAHGGRPSGSGGGGGQGPTGGASPGGSGGKQKTKVNPKRGRLRSYVVHNPKPDEGDPDSEGQNHRSEVDRAGVDKVLASERELGRFPEEQDHFNKGFDIISKDGNGQILRYIEVKSLSGSWGDDGVKISPSQFAFGKEKGVEFWLYVVECALNDEDHNIHRIQDPVGRVEEFLFDTGWQQAAENFFSENPIRENS